MGHRIPAAAAIVALLGAGCASSPPPAAPPGPDAVSPRLHHLLDLDDARAPLRELEPFLRDADPEVRARAALAAARSAPTEAAPALRAAIQDPEPEVRAAAAFAMGITGDADLAGDALLHAKRKDGTDAERSAAAAAAVRLGGERVWKEEAFGALFTSTVPAVRRAAFRALPAAVRGWKEKPTTLPAWFREKLVDLAEPDAGVRVACRIALRTLLTPKPDEPIGSPPAWGLEEIAGALKWAKKLDVDHDARGAAWHLAGLIDARRGRGGEWMFEPVSERAFVGQVRGLSRNTDPSIVKVLSDLIDSPQSDPKFPVSFHVRATACESLGVRKADAAPAVPALAKAARDDPSRLVRVSATLALQLVGGDEAKAAVLALSKSDDAFVRAAAAGTLLPLEDLARLAKDAEPRVRQNAVDEAGKRKDEGKPICLEALRDLDPVVAGIAAGGLGKLGAVDALPTLEEVLRAHPAPAEAPDAWADLRGGVLEALGELKAPSARALAEAHLGDPDPSVVAAAAKVIEGLDGKKPVTPVPPRLLPFPDRAALTISAATRVRFETDRGNFVVETIPSAAPVHCARFLERVRDRGYDGTIFHRVVPAFVIQGGDPRGDGSGNGGAPARQEFSGLPYGRGVLGMPRSDPPDSGGCQLFFCHGDTPHLDQRYTIFGRIVEGVEVIDLIDIGDRILRATVLE